ncbi:RAG1, partial [Symbiodinium microadriaticum]
IVHPDEQRLAKQFVCSVCLCILSDPMQTICDHVFCGECISPCLACPTCRTPISPEDRKPLRECLDGGSVPETKLGPAAAWEPLRLELNQVSPV